MSNQMDRPTESERVRVLIADDHGLLRAGLHALLEAEPDVEAVGEATTGEETVRRAEELSPDVVLLDISMPGPGGIEVTRELKASLPEVRVLILTVHEEKALLREAIRAGAAGYITKKALEPELINAIQAVQRGDLYIHPTMTRALLEESPGGNEVARGDEELVDPLTRRETEVLSFIAQGYTNSETAEILHISVRTVETHRANIMDKLGAERRVELVRYAIDHGLLDT